MIERSRIEDLERRLGDAVIAFMTEKHVKVKDIAARASTVLAAKPSYMKYQLYALRKGSLYDYDYVGQTRRKLKSGSDESQMYKKAVLLFFAGVPVDHLIIQLARDLNIRFPYPPKLEGYDNQPVHTREK